eukprot:s126_g38.t1
MARYAPVADQVETAQVSVELPQCVTDRTFQAEMDDVMLPSVLGRRPGCPKVQRSKGAMVLIEMLVGKGAAAAGMGAVKMASAGSTGTAMSLLQPTHDLMRGVSHFAPPEKLSSLFTGIDTVADSLAHGVQSAAATLSLVSPSSVVGAAAFMGTLGGFHSFGILKVSQLSSWFTGEEEEGERKPTGFNCSIRPSIALICFSDALTSAALFSSIGAPLDVLPQGRAIDLRAQMCLGTSEIGQSVNNISVPVAKCQNSRTSKLPPSAVAEILAAAAQASQEAPNRAVKRRVRQRLHKKLGSLLTCEEFGRAMESWPERWHMSNWGFFSNVPAGELGYGMPTTHLLAQGSKEESGAAAAPEEASSQGPASSVAPSLLPTRCSPQLIALPIFVPMMTPPQALRAPAGQRQPAIPISLAGASLVKPQVEDEDTISELSIEWQRANTLGSAHLPVERTFIQFDTRMHVRHRRSRSV